MCDTAKVRIQAWEIKPKLLNTDEKWNIFFLNFYFLFCISFLSFWELQLLVILLLVIVFVIVLIYDNNLSYSLRPTPLTHSPGVQVNDLKRSTGVRCHGWNGIWTPMHLLHKRWLSKLGGINTKRFMLNNGVIILKCHEHTFLQTHPPLWTKLCLSQGIMGTPCFQGRYTVFL